MRLRRAKPLITVLTTVCAVVLAAVPTVPAGTATPWPPTFPPVYQEARPDADPHPDTGQIATTASGYFTAQADTQATAHGLPAITPPALAEAFGAFRARYRTETGGFLVFEHGIVRIAPTSLIFAPMDAPVTASGLVLEAAWTQTSDGIVHLMDGPRTRQPVTRPLPPIVHLFSRDQATLLAITRDGYLHTLVDSAPAPLRLIEAGSIHAAQALANGDLFLLTATDILWLGPENQQKGRYPLPEPVEAEDHARIALLPGGRVMVTTLASRWTFRPNAAVREATILPEPLAPIRDIIPSDEALYLITDAGLFSRTTPPPTLAASLAALLPPYDRLADPPGTIHDLLTFRRSTVRGHVSLLMATDHGLFDLTPVRLTRIGPERRTTAIARSRLLPRRVVIAAENVLEAFDFTGTDWRRVWKFPRLGHDTDLIALGEGPEGALWSANSAGGIGMYPPDLWLFDMKPAEASGTDGGVPPVTAMDDPETDTGADEPWFRQPDCILRISPRAQPWRLVLANGLPHWFRPGTHRTISGALGSSDCHSGAQLLSIIAETADGVARAGLYALTDNTLDRDIITLEAYSQSQSDRTDTALPSVSDEAVTAFMPDGNDLWFARGSRLFLFRNALREAAPR